MSSVVTGKETMAEKAKLHIGDSEIDLDVVVGTEQERVLTLGNSVNKQGSSRWTRDMSTLAQPAAKSLF